MASYTIEDIKRCRRGNYNYIGGLILIDFLAVRIAWFVVNYTRLTPNKITLIHFILKLCASLFFYFGLRNYLILGALAYLISITLDDVDGKVARVRGEESPMGKYYDYLADAAGDFLCLAALIYSQYVIVNRELWLVVGMLLPFLYLFVSYESILFREAMVNSNKEVAVDKSARGEKLVGFLEIFAGKFKAITNKYKVSYLTLDMADIAILFFVVGPFFGLVNIFLLIGTFFILEKLLVEKIVFILRNKKAFLPGTVI